MRSEREKDKQCQTPIPKRPRISRNVMNNNNNNNSDSVKYMLRFCVFFGFFDNFCNVWLFFW